MHKYIMGGNNVLKPNNLFVLENQVIYDLTEFNKKYAIYLRCGNTGNPNNSKIDLNEHPCPSEDRTVLYNDVKNAYDKLTQTVAPLGSIVVLQNAINSMDTSEGTTPAQYMQNYQTIMSKYEDIVKKRQSLDANLAELYEIGDTKSNFYQRQLMMTSYTKILLTIIASSTLLAIFITMRKK